MEMKEITVYNFDELTQEARGKACEWKRYMGGIDVTEIDQNMKFVIDAKGYLFPSVKWELCHMPGDGVVFESMVSDQFVNEIVERVCDKKTYRKFKRLNTVSGSTLEITHHGNTYNFGSMRVTLIPKIESYGKRTMELFDKVEKEIKEDVRNICKEMEQWGYEQLGELESDETIGDYFRENNYKFTIDGTPITTRIA